MKKIEAEFHYEIVISETIAGAVQSGTGSSWIPLDSLYAIINNAHTSFSKAEADELRELCRAGDEISLKYELRRLFGSESERFVIDWRRS